MMSFWPQQRLQTLELTAFDLAVDDSDNADIDEGWRCSACFFPCSQGVGVQICVRQPQRSTLRGTMQVFHPPPPQKLEPIIRHFCAALNFAVIDTVLGHNFFTVTLQYGYTHVHFHKRTQALKYSNTHTHTHTHVHTYIFFEEYQSKTTYTLT